MDIVENILINSYISITHDPMVQWLSHYVYFFIAVSEGLLQ